MTIRSSTPRGIVQHEARVVDDVVELVDELGGGTGPWCAREEEADREPERDPDDMRVSLGRGRQPLRKNSILTPASSITSWSFSACGALPMRLAVHAPDCCAPSTCVMK